MNPDYKDEQQTGSGPAFRDGESALLRTGLPFVVWISANGGEDVQVRVSVELQGAAVKLVVVAISPRVRIVPGSMTASDLALLERWIVLNYHALMRYEYIEEAIAAIRPIPPA